MMTHVDANQPEHAPSPTTPLAEVMTRAVVSVRPDASLEEVTAVFLSRGISGAPVVDDDGRPIGVISKTDLLRAINDAGADHELQDQVVEHGFHVEEDVTPTVKDVMTPVVFSLSQDSHVSRAAALMAYEGVHRVPIVDEKGRLVGIVSAIDVLRWMAIAHGYVLPRRGH